jgi:hypothetical protein
MVEKNTPMFTFSLLLNSSGTAGYHLFENKIIGSGSSTCKGQYLFKFRPNSQL